MAGGHATGSALARRRPDKSSLSAFDCPSASHPAQGRSAGSQGQEPAVARYKDRSWPHRAPATPAWPHAQAPPPCTPCLLQTARIRVATRHLLLWWCCVAAGDSPRPRCTPPATAKCAAVARPPGDGKFGGERGLDGHSYAPPHCALCPACPGDLAGYPLELGEIAPARFFFRMRQRSRGAAARI